MGQKKLSAVKVWCGGRVSSECGVILRRLGVIRWSSVERTLQGVGGNGLVIHARKGNSCWPPIASLTIGGCAGAM